tara:strand:- start:168 stop:671 length:504 start_codon:yes stop_codon:yes gene_type:complete
MESEDEDDPEDEEDEEEDAPPLPVADMLDFDIEIPIQTQIAGLSEADQRRLGREGDRRARHALLRFAHKRIHIDIVRNEETSVEEIAMLTSRPGLSERALRYICEQRTFMRRDIVMNLVVNPGTSRATALKLMKALTPRELTHILQCPFAPKVVLNAIRKRLEATPS